LSLYVTIFRLRANLEVNKIYNLLCLASPNHYQRDSVQTTKTAVYGAINMLGLAKRTRARIFQASTSEVYGDPAVHPHADSYWGNVNPIGPLRVTVSLRDVQKHFSSIIVVSAN
jgi:GDP-D-mannose dehydratase